LRRRARPIFFGGSKLKWRAANVDLGMAHCAGKEVEINHSGNGSGDISFVLIPSRTYSQLRDPWPKQSSAVPNATGGRSPLSAKRKSAVSI
jgi:hypothetical protein